MSASPDYFEENINKLTLPSSLREIPHPRQEKTNKKLRREKAFFMLFIISISIISSLPFIRSSSQNLASLLTLQNTQTTVFSQVIAVYDTNDSNKLDTLSAKYSKITLLEQQPIAKNADNNNSSFKIPLTSNTSPSWPDTKTKPRLDLTLTLDKSQVMPGTSVKHTVSYSNNSEASVHNVRLTASIPKEAKSADLNHKIHNPRIEEQAIIWNIEEISAHSNGELTYTLNF